MKSRLTLAILSILLASSILQAQVVLNRQASGWCSRDIANVTVNVTVICNGVEPGAVRRLNAELSRKKLEIAATIKEANEWVRRYNELQQRLNENSNDAARSAQAKEYLQEGELEKAGAILDELLNKEETIVDRTADKHYNRALAFELQFLPLQALPHLETAYQSRPNRVEYGEAYGRALLTQNDFRQAETVLLTTLRTARQAANVTPGIYRRYVAGALQNLGIIYTKMNRPNEAESIYREALDVFRQLAASDPGHYERDIAETPNSLATLYAGHQRLAEAEELYTQALDIQRALAQTDESSILDVADTLSNLGEIYFDTQRQPRGEANYVGVVRILRELVKGDPAQFGAYLARALTRLATLYRNTNRSADLATILIERGTVNDAIQQTETAEADSREALRLFRQLAESDPVQYKPYIAFSLNSIALMHEKHRMLDEALPEAEEAVTISREIFKANPIDARDLLGKSLLILDLVLTSGNERLSRGCQLVKEAAGLVSDPELKRRADARMANCQPQ